jgi:hypothetical protein
LEGTSLVCGSADFFALCGRACQWCLHARLHFNLPVPHV